MYRIPNVYICRYIKLKKCIFIFPVIFMTNFRHNKSKLFKYKQNSWHVNQYLFIKHALKILKKLTLSKIYTKINALSNVLYFVLYWMQIPCFSVIINRRRATFLKKLYLIIYETQVKERALLFLISHLLSRCRNSNYILWENENNTPLGETFQFTIQISLKQRELYLTNSEHAILSPCLILGLFNAQNTKFCRGL